MTDTQTEQGQIDRPEELDPEERDKFLQQFASAGQPDMPTIGMPAPGQVQLSYGVEIDGERRTLVQVRELNGADEEAMSKLDPRRDNYIPLLQDKLLQRAVVDIGGRHPTPDHLSQLLMGERDLILFEILLATFGETKEFTEVPCPNCQAKADLEVQLRGMVEWRPLEGVEPTATVFLKDGSACVVGYPTGEDLLSVYQKDRDTTSVERNTQMLGRCILSVNGAPPLPNGHTFALNMAIPDRRKIVRAMDAGAPELSFKEVEVPCETCGQNRPVRLAWADLLFG